MASLTERYNNPGAVEFKPWMSSMGASVGPNGRYAMFNDPKQGYAVMDRILDTYRDKYGLNTVSGIINRWAPSNVDNNSTGSYAKYVASRVGVDPNAPLTPQHRDLLRTAMAEYEAGRKPSFMGSAGASASAQPATGQTGMAGPAWIPQDNINQSRQLSQQFWQTPAGGYGSGWGGGLAAALSGIGSGVFASDASNATIGNQNARNAAISGVANAPDAVSMGRMLMGSNIPGMQDAGLKMIADERRAVAEREANLKQQEKLMQMRGQMELTQARERLPMELEKARAVNRIQNQGAIEQLRERQRLELEALRERARALGLDLGPGPSSSPTETPAAPATPVPASGAGQFASPVPLNGGAAPVAPAAAPGPDEYASLTTPPRSKAEMDAERKKRAAQAIVLGDAKQAGKILNKEEDPKEYQTKDALFGERMIRSEIALRGIIGTPKSPKYDPGNTRNAFWPDDGMLGLFNGQKWREYQAASREWIAGMLRKDTGAAVTDSEWRLYFPTFFPQPGDGPEVQQQKLARRMAAARGLRGSAGPAFERMFPRFDDEMKTQLAIQNGKAPAAPGQKPVPVQSPEEARKLPSGTPILLPDGTIGRVP